MTFSAPPQRWQRSISMAKTRFKRCIPVSETTAASRSSGALGDALKVPCRLMKLDDAQAASGTRTPTSVSSAYSVVGVPCGHEET